MLQRPESACLVIADISGYTAYLAGAELDHAQDILADLIGTVVSALRPTFRLAKLEGDAAFAYTFSEAVDGSAYQDAIERCYFTFRRRLRDIGQASTCDCNACVLIPSLDLKVVAHHGQVARQRIAGREELVGADVVVAHRLLKNDVSEALGVGAYALYSDACVRAMGLADPAVSGLLEHRGTYDGIGEVVGWVRDLEAAWQVELGSTRVFVAPEQALLSIEMVVPAPPGIAWEWFTSPARRLQWQAGITDFRQDLTAGRRGSGTTNHCIHGREAIVEEILDWRPVDYVTSRVQLPIPGIPKFTMTDVLEAVPGGTRLTTRLFRPRSTRDRAALESAVSSLREGYEHARANLIPLIEADVAARSSGPSEPDPPVSLGRYAAPVESGAFGSSSG
jgi:hypothetical protein